MWKPVSGLAFRALNPSTQAIAVVGLDLSRELADQLGPKVEKWKERVAALYALGSPIAVRGVVRDLLANPQVRVVVFDACPDVYRWFLATWRGDTPVPGIDDEHVSLVRQFVDLFDGDFMLRGPQQPFHPSRIMYLE
jgi:hypothetical protein